MFTHAIEVEAKFRIVADGDFNQPRSSSGASAAMVGRTRSNRAANFFCQPIEHVTRRFSRFGDGDWIEEKCDGRVSRRNLDDAGDCSIPKLLKRPQHLVQRFLGRVFALVAHAHNQRGISEGNDFH